MTLRVTPVQLASVLAYLQWSLTACLGFVIVRAVYSSPEVPVSALSESTSKAESPPETPHRADLEDLAGIWQRSLRQALIEPKIPEPPPAKPPPSPPPVALPRLVATFVENGRAWALLVDEKGTSRVRTETEKVGEFEIVSVSPGATTLRRDDKTYEVRTGDRLGISKPRGSVSSERKP